MRYCLVLAYDGTDYHGWQIQEGVATIQEEVQKAVGMVIGEPIQVAGASRTDAGVHAYGNLAVFDAETTIPAEKLAVVINQNLPGNIRVMQSFGVADGFDLRKNKGEKTYRYRYFIGDIMPPLYERFAVHVPYRIQVRAMKEAGKYYEGEHDFAAFCAAGAQVLTTVRTVNQVSVEVTPAIGGEFLDIFVKGEGFLYNMVRIMSGTLLQVGMGRKEPVWVKDAIESCQREQAGSTAPAKGLTLMGTSLDKE